MLITIILQADYGSYLYDFRLDFEIFLAALGAKCEEDGVIVSKLGKSQI